MNLVFPWLWGPFSLLAGTSSFDSRVTLHCDALPEHLLPPSQESIVLRERGQCTDGQFSSGPQRSSPLGLATKYSFPCILMLCYLVHWPLVRTWRVACPLTTSLLKGLFIPFHSWTAPMAASRPRCKSPCAIPPSVVPEGLCLSEKSATPRVETEGKNEVSCISQEWLK